MDPGPTSHVNLAAFGQGGLMFIAAISLATMGSLFGEDPLAERLGGQRDQL